MPRILVGTHKGLFTVAKSGGRWQIEKTAFLGAPVVLAIRDSRDGATYAAINHGHFGCKLHRSDNNGETWTEIAVPAYPKQPDPPEIDGNGRAIEWKLKGIWALEHGTAAQPGVLWMGTAPGGLFKSTDRGQTWALNRPLWDVPNRKKWFGGGTVDAALHSICIDPKDGNRIFIGVSCGGVWYTADGGKTWDVRAKGMKATYMPPEQQEDPDIQDPHHLAMSPSNPDVLWCQHHAGVFKSTDGAKTWSEIKLEPSSFGFAVVVHPKDPNTAWFVPAISDQSRIPIDGKVIVTRTRDGGKTNDVLRKGLPQAHAYDIVYRHALDIDNSGNVLAFGSTTGSLWVSENQGDTWETVGSNLPPVRSVRFCE